MKGRHTQALNDVVQPPLCPAGPTHSLLALSASPSRPASHCAYRGLPNFDVNYSKMGNMDVVLWHTEDVVIWCTKPYCTGMW